MKVLSLIVLMLFGCAPMKRSDIGYNGGRIKNTVHSKIDSFINIQMQANHIAGVSISIMRDGELLYQNSCGYSNLEHHVPATIETVYSIASITKTFTAIATMMLVEAGTISLDDAIGNYFPDFPVAWKPVTIRQLLTHTSGISSFSTHERRPCAVGKDFRKYQRGDLIKEVACLPLEFTPGEKVRYGDTGPYIASLLIEKISGKSYEAFLKENIADPLGMKHTRLVSYTDLIPNRADGYNYRNGGHFLGKRFEEDETDHTQIVSSAADMIKLHHAFSSEVLLKRSSWQQMWTNATLNNGEKIIFGLGFGLTPYQGKRRVGHNGGGGGGFACSISHFLDENITVVVLYNTDHPDIGTFVNTVASFYFRNQK